MALIVRDFARLAEKWRAHQFINKN